MLTIGFILALDRKYHYVMYRDTKLSEHEFCHINVVLLYLESNYAS